MSIKQAIEALLHVRDCTYIDDNGRTALMNIYEPEHVDAALAALRSMQGEAVGEREAFEAELRKQCFQKPTTEAYDLAWSMWKARALRSYDMQSPTVEQVEHLAPYRCLKPHCPPICSGCNRAIPVTDTAKMLMVKVLDSLAVDDLGNPFEEGDHMAVDEARAWLCDATPHTEAVRMSEAEIREIADSTKTAEPGRDGYILPYSFARAVEQATFARLGVKMGDV